MGALSIYKTLTEHGLSSAGALGLMGNMYAESTLQANIVQRGFSKGMTDVEFTSYVDNNGCWPDGFGGGYGLCQWTYYTRRNALLAYAKLQGVSIGNEQMQVEFCLAELASDYSGLLSYLKTTDDMYTATSRVCQEYERPAVNNIEARYRYACNLKNQVCGTSDDSDQEEATTPAAVETDKTANVQVGFRMLYKGITGYKDQVIFMQQVLNLRGYAPAIDGIFGDETDRIVKQFQTDNGLTADGYAGHDTLTALYGGI